MSRPTFQLSLLSAVVQLFVLHLRYRVTATLTGRPHCLSRSITHLRREPAQRISLLEVTQALQILISRAWSWLEELLAK